MTLNEQLNKNLIIQIRNSKENELLTLKVKYKINYQINNNNKK